MLLKAKPLYKKGVIILSSNNCYVNFSTWTNTKGGVYPTVG